jgi:hypothetical protein
MIVTLDDRWAVRRGTAADLATVNEVPLAGELVLATDTRKLKVGDGVTAYNSLLYVGELANLGNPVGDRLVYWDDTAQQFAFLALGTGLTIGSGGDLDASGGTAGQASIQFKDDGTNLGTAGTAVQVDYTGAGVTASRAGNNVTVNIPGGGGGATYTRTTVTTLTSLAGAIIPYDNTIPQNTEGVEFTALATTITPANAADVLMVEIVMPTVTATGAVTIMAALFRDSAANAVAAWFTAPAAASYSSPMVLRYIFTAGSTSATTFRLRMGGSSSTTIRINGEGTTALGAIIPATLTIHKIA